MLRYGAAIPVLNDWRFLPAVVGQLSKVCDRIVILRSRKSFSGSPITLSEPPIIFDKRVEIVSGEWEGETETRNAGMEVLADCDYVFTVDSDEIFTLDAFRLLMRVAEVDRIGGVSCLFKTYWKTCAFQIDPPETIGALVLVRKDMRFYDRRSIVGAQAMLNTRLMHHLSYVRTDEEVQEKLRCFGHASEVVPDWFENVWKKWDNERNLCNLHPTSPPAFKQAVHIKSTIESLLQGYGCE